MRARLLLPDGSMRELSLGADEAVVIGRDPRTEALQELAASSPLPRTVTVDVPGISATHAAIWCSPSGAHVADLGSRNGTWLEVPPQRAVTLPPTDEMRDEARIGLAVVSPSGVVADEPEPADAEWTSAAEFPAAIARAAKTWLDVLGEDATVIVDRQGGDDADLGGPIPLPRGLYLHVHPSRTVDAQWLPRMATLWRYVDTQVRYLEAEESSREEGLILASTAMRAAHRQVVEAASRGQRLVLLGPSGAGKEGLARAYHRHSGRSGPFVALNCGELNRELLRAELFGAEEGAFTGSVKKIVGAVERAHGGTLFLDEIGDIPLDVQPMLLRFLDRGEYTRLGAYGQVLRSDVRIVCATNRELRDAIQRGQFRQDLWFRLSIQVVDVPPLHARFDDVLAFLRSRELGAGVSALEALSPAALDVLRRHRWDGNFRELANFVERLPTVTEPHDIDEELCRQTLQRGAIRIAPIDEGDAGAPHRPHADRERWTAWCETALQAFATDHADGLPATWDEVQELLEKYLKPLLMVRLGLGDEECDEEVTRARESLPRLARRLAEIVRADRGTALKQLTRYVERFAAEPGGG
jgi:DNA-binding NtrC family response regulator